MEKINKSKRVSKKPVRTVCTGNENIKDHAENDFKQCDKLITNIGGKRIELDRQQQKEILEFVYAIGSC
ncbi:MAG: hypothetical protein ABI543_01815 [Ignavibacteria bacterium]